MQARAGAYCEEVRRSAECWQLCLQRFSSSSFVEVRFWCLQTLHEVRRAAGCVPAARCDRALPSSTCAVKVQGVTCCQN